MAIYVLFIESFMIGKVKGHVVLPFFLPIILFPYSVLYIQHFS